MARCAALLVFSAAVLVAVTSAQNSPAQSSYSAGSCCDQRTYHVTSSAYEPISINQNSVFVSIHIETGLNQSNEAVQQATASAARVLGVLRQPEFFNITDIQQTGVAVTVRNNFSCEFGTCSNTPIGYQSDNTISFNAPLALVNTINIALLTIPGASIRNQQGFIPPEIFGAAQNIAIKRALTYAQYRAEQTYSGLPGVKLGLPRTVVVTSNDYLSSGGSANGAVQGTAAVTYDLIPSN
jgi:uncharacterized protein YggE